MSSPTQCIFEFTHTWMGYILCLMQPKPFHSPTAHLRRRRIWWSLISHTGNADRTREMWRWIFHIYQNVSSAVPMCNKRKAVFVSGCCQAAEMNIKCTLLVIICNHFQPHCSGRWQWQLNQDVESFLAFFHPSVPQRNNLKARDHPAVQGYFCFAGIVL